MCDSKNWFLIMGFTQKRKRVVTNWMGNEENEKWANGNKRKIQATAAVEQPKMEMWAVNVVFVETLSQWIIYYIWYYYAINDHALLEIWTTKCILASLFMFDCTFSLLIFSYSQQNHYQWFLCACVCVSPVGHSAWNFLFSPPATLQFCSLCNVNAFISIIFVFKPFYGSTHSFRILIYAIQFGNRNTLKHSHIHYAQPHVCSPLVLEVVVLLLYNHGITFRITNLVESF